MMQAKPLTQEAFSAFGDVIEVSDNNEHFAINQGYTTRHHKLAAVETIGDGAQGIISIFRSTPLALPIKIGMMERHPQGSQAFMPLSDNPYLVVVAPKGELDLRKIEVFLAQSHQGVNYHTGTWHHFCLALNEVSDFLVVDRCGAGNNCDEVTIEEPQQITIEF
ncbi:ureidoglycolate lyase [Psychrobium sp. MM17-31]|uniref:ureidoglycolate lyase n=1 Tax=Psychrobium sp. MM17-31 TaxID=2917758 RepID=UPI001EF59521|nr:ureidoglycolate lyase [Psychrobium sp. MM17-31]MCG7532585.1 ureidoglycolate lyase [Psychrobium sp. MM17-31]